MKVVVLRTKKNTSQGQWTLHNRTKRQWCCGGQMTPELRCHLKKGAPSPTQQQTKHDRKCQQKHGNTNIFPAEMHLTLEK